MLKLFLLTQTTNQEYGTFDSAVVVATDEAAAKLIHPAILEYSEYEGTHWVRRYEPSYEFLEDDILDLHYYSWAHPDNVTVKYIGEAAPDLVAGQVVCSSFNAG